MTNSTSLVQIMRDDPEFGKRIQKKVQDIKKDTEGIFNLASKYSEQYKQEIAEGTELRNRLITENTQKGLSEEQIMASYGRFCPTVQTPILNMLFFLLRESDNDPNYGQTLYAKRDKINEYLVKTNRLDHRDNDDLTEKEADAILNEFITDAFAPQSSDVRQQVNSIFENEKKFRPVEEAVKLKAPDNMVDYLYADLTLEQFDILKKLKNLTQSSNIHEATMAFQKGKELCKKYDLDWERIPCYNRKK